MNGGRGNPGKISFYHVSFSYKADAPNVFDDICLGKPCTEDRNFSGGEKGA